MELTDLKQTINLLISYWEERGIPILKISSTQKNLEILKKLPLDFVEFYQCVNGMPPYFPIDMDEEGFS